MQHSDGFQGAVRTLSAPILCLLAVFLAGCDNSGRESRDKYLVEVSYSFPRKQIRLNREPPFEVAFVECTLFMSKEYAGSIVDDPGWGRRQTRGRFQDNTPKASACFALLKSIEEPKALPESPTEIVTVTCKDGTQLLVRRFPRAALPNEVRKILTTMGFSNVMYEELTFVPNDAA
jgi:hypothetical protein